MVLGKDANASIAFQRWVRQKGRTRRVVSMTDRLRDALKGIPTVDPHALGVCTLRERGWHVLRHSFATHAAMFGVNPWSLQNWLGHKRMEETMIHVALGARGNIEIS
jgi:integrase